ncbi:DUF6095 family protein [Aequorivita echinoideorum]|uniref:Uncharacterized protein n=1 Tax=Aequorivita echinoideorum TaxID=1549647 RepID=A0ABS5S7E9_9FLAO|nr:DUF6095 family protein [Aequorivita echinoideorum]MBT0609139.1 hypothetical protein [Aequorivita echinoideorum]
MGKEHTDVNLLKKGLKYMAFALPLLFLSPYLITISFLNKENFTLYIFLFFGIIAGAGAIYLCFKGIKTILESIF